MGREKDETLNGLNPVGLIGVENEESRSNGTGEDVVGRGEALGESHGDANSSDDTGGDPIDFGRVMIPLLRADGGRLRAEAVLGDGLAGSESGDSIGNNSSHNRIRNFVSTVNSQRFGNKKKGPRESRDKFGQRGSVSSTPSLNRNPTYAG